MTDAPDWQRKAAEGIARAEKRPNNRAPTKFGSKGVGVGGPAKGAGAGDGWGGSARGDAAIAGPEALIPGQPEEKRLRSTMRERKAAEVAEEMKDILYDLAYNAERQETQLSAAGKLLDRIEGLSVQRVIGGTVQTVEEIRAANPVDASREYQRIIGR